MSGHGEGFRAASAGPTTTIRPRTAEEIEASHSLAEQVNARARAEENTQETRDYWRSILPAAVFADTGTQSSGSAPTGSSGSRDRNPPKRTLDANGEKPGHREAIDRMTGQLVQSGMPAPKAREQAVAAAIRTTTHR